MEVLVFDELAVALVESPPEQLRAVRSMAVGESEILAIEPERYVYAIQEAALGDASPAVIGRAPQVILSKATSPEPGRLVPPATLGDRR